MSQKARRKPLSDATKKSLKKKAEGTKFKYGELAAVYRKDKAHIFLVVLVMYLWLLGQWVGSTVI